MFYMAMTSSAAIEILRHCRAILSPVRLSLPAERSPIANPRSAGMRRRGWIIALQAKEAGSGASERLLREKLLDAARHREIDVVLVWRLLPAGCRSAAPRVHRILA
jgi:hypothetical protein